MLSWVKGIVVLVYYSGATHVPHFTFNPDDKPIINVKKCLSNIGVPSINHDLIESPGLSFSDVSLTKRHCLTGLRGNCKQFIPFLYLIG